MNEKILVIEDDKSIQNFLRISLKSLDYHPVNAYTLKEGFAMYASQNPDLVLLDLGLPDGEGIEFVKSVRDYSAVPIIILSARGQEDTKIEALDKGADDYITKPFNIGELMARIRVCLRHKDQRDIQSQKTVFTVRGLTIDYEKHTVKIDDETIKVTPIEFKILKLLSLHAGKVMVHSFIIKEVWGQQYQDTQSLRVFMTNLRRKIEKDSTNPEYLLTEVGVGYKLIDE
jgi:two-component system KDP operon response regulator KdpE